MTRRLCEDVSGGLLPLLLVPISCPARLCAQSVRATKKQIIRPVLLTLPLVRVKSLSARLPASSPSPLESLQSLFEDEHTLYSCSQPPPFFLADNWSNFLFQEDREAWLSFLATHRRTIRKFICMNIFLDGSLSLSLTDLTMSVCLILSMQPGKQGDSFEKKIQNVWKLNNERNICRTPAGGFNLFLDVS